MQEKVKSRQSVGRPRSESARESILTETWRLLKEDGLDQLTIENVAARAQVGKTTIYRWWKNKGALAVEAFLVGISPTIVFPDTGSTRTDVSEQMTRLAQVYDRRGDTGRIVCEMIGHGQHDREMLNLFYEGYLAPRRMTAKVVLQRGIERGEIRPDIDFDIVIDALYAPLFHRLLIGHAANDEVFLQFLITSVFKTIEIS